MTKVASRGLACLTVVFGAVMCLTLRAAHPADRNTWYWDSVVNLHVDNHSNLVGKGHTAAEIAAMIRDIPVDMVQVSAYGAVGDSVTYPTRRLPELLNPKLAGYDTLAVWREAVTSCGKRFHVYLNTRGLNLYKNHPKWMQQDSSGKGRGTKPGLFDACPRPAPNDDGYLEKILLPLLEEVSQTYHPGGFWVDGDHARTRTCYCPNCREAWRRETGKANPPTQRGDPDWSAWLRFEQERYDAYRQRMAQTIHQLNPQALYTSNHSWRKTFGPTFDKIDPRDPPPFADTASADLSHGISLQETRLSAMLLSADEDTPHDIMHLVNGGTISLGRVLQQGAITLSFGGPRFLWVSGSSITQPAAQERARLCAQFGRDRAEACGRSESRNPYAVLVSETTWLPERHVATAGYHDFLAANHFALALQDAACGVDLVNESLFRRRPGAYRCVVVPNQRLLAPETLTALADFARNGGVVLWTGGTMRPGDSEDPEAQRLLGVQRAGRHAGSARMAIDHDGVDVGTTWNAEPVSAKVLAALGDGRPALTEKACGKGRMLWLNLDRLPSPEFDGVVPWVLCRAGLGPSFCIDAPADAPHLVMAVRRKGGRTLLHLTDLTSYIGGIRVPPERSDMIDDARSINPLRIRVAMPKAPKAVRVVPGGTSVGHTWSDGVLSLTLGQFRVHAAVLVDGVGDGPAPLLPADTTQASRFAWVHYTDPRSVQLNFETESQGHVLEPFRDCTLRESGPLRIVASEETASEGKTSAKFIDGPDEKGFFPYLFIQTIDLAAGTARFSADLRLGAGSQPSIEFRTVENRRANPVGPSLRFGADGPLRTEQGKSLGVLPHDQWFRIEIACPLGSGKYDVRVAISGRPPQEFPGLPCVGGTSFERCGWIGICSHAREESVFYLDNVRVERTASEAALRLPCTVTPQD